MKMYFVFLEINSVNLLRLKYNDCHFEMKNIKWNFLYYDKNFIDVFMGPIDQSLFNVLA